MKKKIFLVMLLCSLGFISCEKQEVLNVNEQIVQNVDNSQSDLEVIETDDEDGGASNSEDLVENIEEFASSILDPNFGVPDSPHFLELIRTSVENIEVYYFFSTLNSKNDLSTLDTLSDDLKNKISQLSSFKKFNFVDNDLVILCVLDYVYHNESSLRIDKLEIDGEILYFSPSFQDPLIGFALGENTYLISVPKNTKINDIILWGN